MLTESHCVQVCASTDPTERSRYGIPNPNKAYGLEQPERQGGASVVAGVKRRGRSLL